MAERRNFDAVAAGWDENSGRVKLLGDIAEALRAKVALTPDMALLDFGCGTGLMSLHLAAQVASLTGVDSSAAMLEVFMQKADRLGLSNVRARQLDLDQGATLPGRYDLIVSSMAFHHIQNLGTVLAQCHAALKPGGRLCIADLDLDDGLFHEDPTGVFHNGFDRKVFCAILPQAGFADVQASQAAEVTRPVVTGGTRRFTIFLACGRKAV